MHYADETKSKIITNDRYRDYSQKHDWLLENHNSRLLAGNMQKNGFITIDGLPYGNLVSSLEADTLYDTIKNAIEKRIATPDHIKQIEDTERRLNLIINKIENAEQRLSILNNEIEKINSRITNSKEQRVYRDQGNGRARYEDRGNGRARYEDRGYEQERYERARKERERKERARYEKENTTSPSEEATFKNGEKCILCKNGITTNNPKDIWDIINKHRPNKESNGLIGISEYGKKNTP